MSPEPTLTEALIIFQMTILGEKHPSVKPVKGIGLLLQ
jgi:hypothetical protein